MKNTTSSQKPKRKRGKQQHRASRHKQFPWRLRSTILNSARSHLPIKKDLPDKIGKHSKRMDKALPGEHTKTMYDQLTSREASVLVQLRTGMARFNEFLHRIGAAQSDRCVRGSARETVDNFLFRCTKRKELRRALFECTTTHRGICPSFLEEKPHLTEITGNQSMKAVRATIKFAIATSRLDNSASH